VLEGGRGEGLEKRALAMLAIHYELVFGARSATKIVGMLAAN